MKFQAKPLWPFHPERVEGSLPPRRDKFQRGMLYSSQRTKLIQTDYID
jgi:hypothetical protein